MLTKKGRLLKNDWYRVLGVGVVFFSNQNGRKSESIASSSASRFRCYLLRSTYGYVLGSLHKGGEDPVHGLLLVSFCA